jgi:hypothetical protein
MTRVGRKPLGPALVQHLEGSERAKQRLEIILETVAGHLTVDDAAHQLGIEHAMFYRLRTEVLSAGLARLEPRPMGRPQISSSAEALQCKQLQRRVDELESELKIAVVREEIAHVLPHQPEAESLGKKTAELTNQERQQRLNDRKKRHLLKT